jgi:photosystem II stability/assembly factor-like uncharacterized protein
MLPKAKKTALLLAILLATPCMGGAVWYKENLAYGLRDAILLFLSFAPSDPQTMYLATTDGYVFSTHNQGAGWDEARLIVKSRSFFGAIRPTVAPDGAPISASDVLEGASGLLGLGYDLQRHSYFDYDGFEAELDFLEDGVDSVAYAPAERPYLDMPSRLYVRDRAGGGARGGDSAKLGVGLKCGAPRLKSALREIGAPSVGMNLQQLLVEMGVEPTWINHIAVHPRDPDTAVAATSMGTYRTTDGGIGWLPVFAGTDRWERDGQHVRYDPLNPDKVFLGTQSGLFISNNGGDRWERVSGTMLESAYVTWLETVVRPDNAVWVFAGTDMGAFFSRNGGDTWKWIFYETLPDANWISSIGVDRQDPRHVLLSTWDGLYVTFDAGENWEVAGGLMFTGTYVPRVLVDPENGAHAFACDEQNIWETTDHGRTWQVIYIDNSDWKIRNMELDPHEPGTLWIVTSGQILRLRPYRKAVSRTGRVQAFREAMAGEPSETDVLAAAFDNFHISPGEQTRYRSRLALAALMPEVAAVGGYLGVRSHGGINFGQWRPFYDAPHLGRDGDYAVAYGGVMLYWDLGPVVFDFDRMNVGRVWGDSLGTMYSLKFEMARYYNERIRLLYKLIVEPPETTMEYLDAALRYRELTEHLDALTGGLYQQQLAAIRNGGVEWLRGLESPLR